MINLAALIGAPIKFDENIYIYPPTVRDIVTNDKFNFYYQVLTTTQDDIQEQLKDKLPADEKLPTPLEFLLMHCEYVEDFSLIANEAFRFFCRMDADFSNEKKIISLGNFSEIDPEEPMYQGIAFLNEANFFNFQNAIREACGCSRIEPAPPFDPDEDPRIRRIKEKARKRDRIKAKQAGKGGISLDTCLTAICCMGIGITPLNIGEMSYAAVGPIMRVMQDKEKYDIDIRSLLAGADSKKVKPKYWIRNSNE